MVNIVGNATAMMPVNDEVVAHLHEEQQNFYDGVSTFLAQRGSQPLSTSIHASAKPSGRFNRKVCTSFPFTRDSQALVYLWRTGTSSGLSSWGVYRVPPAQRQRHADIT